MYLCGIALLHIDLETWTGLGQANSPIFVMGSMM